MLYIGGAISSGSAHSSRVRSSWLRDIRRLAQREAAQHQPGQRHHHRARGGHRQRDRLDAGRQVEQPDPEGRILDDRARACAQRADRHQHRAGRPEQPGPPQRDELGVVERASRRSARRRASAAIDVLRDRQAGCHHSSVAVARSDGGTVTRKGALAGPVSGIPSQWCCENPSGGDARLRRRRRPHGRADVGSVTPAARSCSCCWRRARSPPAEIGERLGISAAGVRRHLDALIDAGDAQANAAAAWQHNGRGRPAKRYRLTAAGRAKLGHAYDDLAVGGDAPAARDRRRRRRPHVRAAAHRHHPGRGRADAARRRRRRGDGRPRRRRADQGRVRDHHHAGGRADPRRADLPASLPGVARRRGVPGAVRDRAQAFAEILGTHVQRLATIVNGDCACTTHVPLNPTRR